MKAEVAKKLAEDDKLVKDTDAHLGKAGDLIGDLEK
jgi:hypothetical protein